MLVRSPSPPASQVTRYQCADTTGRKCKRRGRMLWHVVSLRQVAAHFNPHLRRNFIVHDAITCWPAGHSATAHGAVAKSTMLTDFGKQKLNLAKTMKCYCRNFVLKVACNILFRCQPSSVSPTWMVHTVHGHYYGWIAVVKQRC